MSRRFPWSHDTGSFGDQMRKEYVRHRISYLPPYTCHRIIIEINQTQCKDELFFVHTEGFGEKSPSLLL